MVKLFGGTSDEFEYNQSDTQTPANERNIKSGETFEVISEFTGPVEENFEKGDENLGSSGEFTVGSAREVTVGVSADRNGLEVTAGGEFALGVEGKVERHAGIGPLSGAFEENAVSDVTKAPAQRTVSFDRVVGGYEVTQTPFLVYTASSDKSYLLILNHSRDMHEESIDFSKVKIE